MLNWVECSMKNLGSAASSNASRWRDGLGSFGTTTPTVPGFCLRRTFLRPIRLWFSPAPFTWRAHRCPRGGELRVRSNWWARRTLIPSNSRVRSPNWIYPVSIFALVVLSRPPKTRRPYVWWSADPRHQSRGVFAGDYRHSDRQDCPRYVS